MAKRVNCSPSYLAGEFHDSLTRSGRYDIPGATWKAEQHGDRVDFQFARNRYDIKFESKNGNGIQAILEIMVEGQFEPFKVLNLEPEINGTGDIPLTYFPKAILIELTNGE